MGLPSARGTPAGRARGRGQMGGVAGSVPVQSSSATASKRAVRASSGPRWPRYAGPSGRIAVSAELSTGSPQRSAPAATAPCPSRASARCAEPLEVVAEVALSRPVPPEGTLRTRPRLA